MHCLLCNEHIVVLLRFVCETAFQDALQDLPSGPRTDAKYYRVGSNSTGRVLYYSTYPVTYCEAPRLRKSSIPHPTIYLHQNFTAQSIQNRHGVLVGTKEYFGESHSPVTVSRGYEVVQYVPVCVDSQHVQSSRFKDAHVKSTPRFKDDNFSKSKVTRRYTIFIWG